MRKKKRGKKAKKVRFCLIENSRRQYFNNIDSFVVVAFCLGHKFNEEGRFKKGHSIRGKHITHKLDESKKNKDFFDEDYDGGFDEKHGQFEEKHGSEKGKAFKKGHQQSSFGNEKSGKKGNGKKGSHSSGESG